LVKEVPFYIVELKENQKASAEVKFSPQRLYMGTFRKLILILPSQKVGGFVVKFTRQRREEIMEKILLTSWAVKGKISSPRCPYLLAKIDNFPLN
jgi:hypothetical protein